MSTNEKSAEHTTLTRDALRSLIERVRRDSGNRMSWEVAGGFVIGILTAEVRDEVLKLTLENV